MLIYLGGIAIYGELIFLSFLHKQKRLKTNLKLSTIGFNESRF